MMEIDNSDLNFKINEKFVLEKLAQFNKINNTCLPSNFEREIHYNYKNLTKNYESQNSALNENVPQYSTLYHIRLNKLKKKLINKAHEKWPNTEVIENLLNLKEKNTEKIIFGLFFKEMKLRPSILKGMESILGANKVKSFLDQSDKLFFEDNSSRIKISENNINIAHFVTGIIAAIKGYLDEKGQFCIVDTLYHEPEYQRLQNENIFFNQSEERNLKNFLERKSEVIMLTSGLSLDCNIDTTGKNYLSISLLKDFFQGKLFKSNVLNNLVKRINRLIICGNLINVPQEVELVTKGSYSNRHNNQKIYKTILDIYNEADKLIANLSSSVLVDLMPGMDDISNSMFPQSPIHDNLFEESVKTKNLNLVPNPYNFEINDINFLVTSGQNIDNLKQYSAISENSVDLMEKNLEWGHIAPNAPDTIKTFPISSEDPLIIEKMPHVYVCGNQNEFGTNQINLKNNHVRLISVPKFCKTHSIVFLDVSNLDCFEYKLEYYNS